MEKHRVSNAMTISARYSGNESFFANEEDVFVCWEAVQEAKQAVDCYLQEHIITLKSILED